MSAQTTMDALERAWSVKDPKLALLCTNLVKEDHKVFGDYRAEEAQKNYANTVRSEEFKNLPDIEKAKYRVQQFKIIEEEEHERFGIYSLLLKMWEDNGSYARCCLKEIIASCPLKFGTWKAVKKIFKDAEDQNDFEMFGAIAARIDYQMTANNVFTEPQMKTLNYIRKRGWRKLRETGISSPSLYCQFAVDILKAYPDFQDFDKTWIANHIFYHESGKYSGNNFQSSKLTSDRVRFRAFPELWQLNFQPMVRLIEEASSSSVREFAIASLKKDHAISLREISENVIIRLLRKNIAEVDDFCIWIFNSVPKFEHSALRDLGLHDSVLKLLNSKSKKAQHFAASYARTHAKDLPLEQVIELVNHASKEIRELAVSLINERDPRKDIGLESWSKLLGTKYGNALAEKSIIKNFSAKDMTREWFQECLLEENSHDFAAKHLYKVHKLNSLGAGFFYEMFDSPKLNSLNAGFVLNELGKFKAEDIDIEFIKKALVNSLTQSYVLSWVETGFLDSKLFGVDFLMMLSFHPERDTDPWVKELVDSNKDFEDERYPVEFDQYLSMDIFSWLSDVRKFQPNEVGFDRLMQLVERKEETYHDFASKYMIKAFVPADFAVSEEEEPAADAGGEINVDFEGQSFVFTGKLNTMTRSEAQGKVKVANGKKGSGVTGNLDYLVIGDEGSPFYGAGKKGSKQLKAESLVANGADLKIISETAFLQMLSGTRKEADSNTVEAGCERLWEFITKKGSEQNPLRLFAIDYFRNHHQDICPLITERPVDPGAEIPHEFLSYERLLPLLKEKRQTLVDFALELAAWEASAWEPDFNSVFELCETGSVKIKEFLSKAFTAGPEKVNDRIRLDRNLITADNVYRFCESPDDFARGLGMQLLDMNPQLADAASLFRLTESGDRRMRYFAVEAIWKDFRDRGVSGNWKPPKIKKEEKSDEKGIEEESVQELSPWLSEIQTMQSFLKRMLYEIPPGRFGKTKRKKVKTLAACKAKIALVETYRNMSLSDEDFAKMAVPVLNEFMESKGLLEERTCLVALTRIAKKYPHLSPWKETAS